MNLHKRNKWLNKKIREYNSSIPVTSIKKTRLTTTLTIITTAIVLFALVLVVKQILKNSSNIAQITESAGIFGPIILILIITIGILLSPIPSVVLIITAGYLYGVWWGAIYSYIGNLLAAIAVFALVRKFEKEGVQNTNKKHLKYKNLIRKNQNLLYLLYILPIIPISITSILSASTKVSWKKFLKIISISFLPTVLFFSYFGYNLSNKNLILIGIIVVIFIVAIYYIRKILNKNKTIQ